ncbi:methyltransferase domain-containing protein [Adhaeribacter swui]|uniref:Methyltransferase domain-containing protein n=1 Tax=Adhaeribacter swui TaxID=2086471 RepID=A0A7G7GE28_9BACT|nr:class I SAM-dependent methyltransferase [Adhaeribacter swui]QNF35412.1 methyltransferase domain-containing protein [Adhaeribacter swui]
MGFYAQVITPRVMNFFMSAKEFPAYRAELLKHAQGKVLEIGFGSGLNLPFYPEHIKQIDTVDSNAGMQPLAQKNIAQSAIQVKQHTLSAEQLPFADNTFDTVVSTWTLCSIPDVAQALSEIKRILKPEGRFLFVEHGLSPEVKVQKWQHRLNPVQKTLFDGCHLDRNIEKIVAGAGFKFEKLRKEYAGSPKLFSYFYFGIAHK